MKHKYLSYKESMIKNLKKQELGYKKLMKELELSKNTAPKGTKRDRNKVYKSFHKKHMEIIAMLLALHMDSKGYGGHFLPITGIKKGKTRLTNHLTGIMECLVCGEKWDANGLESVRDPWKCSKGCINQTNGSEDEKVIVKSHLKEYFELNGDRIVSIWVDYLPNGNGFPWENCEMRSLVVKNDKERDEAKAYLIENWEQDINCENQKVKWVTK